MMQAISRRNIIKPLLIAPVAGYLPGWETDRLKNDCNNDFEPGYLKLHKTGELKERGEKLWRIMENCRLCPRECYARLYRFL